MGRLNFRIGTKLGIAAGAGVLLVGGMLTNEMLGNQSIATISEHVINNYVNRDNAEAAEIAMARAELAAMEVRYARSDAQVDASLLVLREKLTAAATQLDAVAQRARREFLRDDYRETGTLVATYLNAGVELAAAEKTVIAAAPRGVDETAKAEDAKETSSIRASFRRRRKSAPASPSW
jgi:hypothetical protein